MIFLKKGEMTHMGYIEDLNSIIRSVSSIKTMDPRGQHKSIARGALDGTMQFSCLMASSIPSDWGFTIARMLERTYASFAQTYLSLNNTIDISVDKNPNQFLKKFHRNVKLESTAEDLYFEHCVESDEEYDNLMTRIYNGTTKAYVNESGDKMIIFNFSDDFNADVFESNRELLEESLSNVDFKPFPNIGNSPFYEDKPSIDPEAEALRADIKKSRDTEVERNKVLFNMNTRDKMEVPRIVFTDNDAKKSNDMQPYQMQVRLMAVNSSNEFVQFMDFIVGIKVVLHSIKSDEMIINIGNTLQNTGKIFNFIRWTTGEKSLFKDLIFNINSTKLDVANKSKGASPWWSTLKRLKNTSKAQSAFFARTQVVPNSTLVISSYEVETITTQIGYSLRDPHIAKRLMDSLFLMCFIIVDEGTRTIEILYDQETDFQTYSLESLEHEVSMSSNKIGKEITRMLSR